ncbi:MAG TPA: hypothetical protein VGL89_16145 [Candidatus Koribacter sp.]|jgi:hypothetical protein
MKKAVILAVLALSIAGFGAQTGVRTQANTNVPSQAGALRVNTPKANEVVRQDFVHVTYQLVNRGATPATSPNFTVQLDGTDPITTTAYDYTFTGLTLGAHTITVTLVDANGTPIANSSVSTKFTVVDGTRAPRAPSGSLFRKSSMQLASSEISPLPTPLPMLSLVGFAVLIGGICTAIRNRR